MPLTLFEKIWNSHIVASAKAYLSVLNEIAVATGAAGEAEASAETDITTA